MSHWLFLMPVSLLMGFVALAAFFWAVRNHQFDDPEGDARRILTTDYPSEVEGHHDDDMASQSENRDPAGRL